MMAFTTLSSVAIPLDMINVDTDKILPASFMKTITRAGLGRHLLAPLRYLDDGSPDPDFVLNKPAYQGARIIIAGDNFGCGSSREHAPWALQDYGIRCVISTSFADIFFANCFKNGILPVVVSADELALLMDDALRGANSLLTVDLAAQTITRPDGALIGFEVDPFSKHCMINGLDEIELTNAKISLIEAYEKRTLGGLPWL